MGFSFLTGRSLHVRKNRLKPGQLLLERKVPNVEKKLTKVATVTKVSFLKCNIAVILIGISCLSVLTTLAFYSWGESSSLRLKSVVDRSNDLMEQNKRLQDERTQIFGGMDNLVGETLPAITSELGKHELTACLENPIGLVFSPRRLNIVDLTVHNQGTIMNTLGTVFALGDHCVLHADAKLFVAAKLNGVLQLIITGKESMEREGCPMGAYKLIPAHGEIIDRLIIKGCLAKANALELPGLNL